MFEREYFGISLWVWLIIGIIMFGYYLLINNCELPQSELKPEKFSDITKPKIKVFNFNTSWCGWSKRFQPEWDEFSKKTKTDARLSHVEAYDIKCDDPKNESMCEDYKVQGYPFVVIESAGERKQYAGDRTANALTNYLI